MEEYAGVVVQNSTCHPKQQVGILGHTTRFRQAVTLEQGLSARAVLAEDARSAGIVEIAPVK